MSRITYLKWWHRFSPHHRKMIRVMNVMVEYNWENGGREEYKKALKKAIIKGMICYPISGFKYSKILPDKIKPGRFIKIKTEDLTSMRVKINIEPLYK